MFLFSDHISVVTGLWTVVCNFISCPWTGKETTETQTVFCSRLWTVYFCCKFGHFVTFDPSGHLRNHGFVAWLHHPSIMQTVEPTCSRPWTVLHTVLGTVWGWEQLWILNLGEADCKLLSPLVGSSDRSWILNNLCSCILNYSTVIDLVSSYVHVMKHVCTHDASCVH